MANGLTRVVVREQNPQVRATNFDEVCYGYNKEEAMEEAARCLNCKKPKCVEGCPVSIDIPAFIAEVKEGNFEEAFKIISQSSALPAVCGRVCPQESQCEGKCIRGIKGEPVAIGKLERFVADWARENGIKPQAPAEKNGKKVDTVLSCPVSYETLQFTDSNRLTFDSADTFSFALALLRTNTSTYCRKCGRLADDLECFLEVSFFYFCDECRDINRYRTTLYTFRFFTVQATSSFLHCLFFIVTVAYFVKVSSTNLRVLLSDYYSC